MKSFNMIDPTADSRKLQHAASAEHQQMRLLVHSTGGSTGKSCVTAGVLFPVLGGQIISIHGVGGGTSDYKVPATSVGTDELDTLAEALSTCSENLIVDVGSSGAVAFETYIEGNRSLLQEFDAVVIPTKPGYYSEEAAVDAINWLLECGLDRGRVRVVFNETDVPHEVPKRFPIITRFLMRDAGFVNVSQDCVLPWADLFDRSYLRYSIPAMLAGTVDYEARLQQEKKKTCTDQEKLKHLVELAIAQEDARDLRPQLERTFNALNLVSRSSIPAQKPDSVGPESGGAGDGTV